MPSPIRYLPAIDALPKLVTGTLRAYDTSNTGYSCQIFYTSELRMAIGKKRSVGIMPKWGRMHTWLEILTVWERVFPPNEAILTQSLSLIL